MGPLMKTWAAELSRPLSMSKWLHLSMTSRPNWEALPALLTAATNRFSDGNASLQGRPPSSAVSAAKQGMCAIDQSIACEYHPQSIHVAHFVLHGMMSQSKPQAL
ncbi:hypothetical protein K437DRAFT_72839 [Tilletiaria anomala UBC 951]|uniref:Uncharacterized protein n=1 Tax=Tilletiaria anomala (strain ATCC 24038 / CBS 436.72 / UBC 951) TaxID=1037660 RepID=A0A066WR59_TILAU|nr:uncharacterized protein K437DRAFT_72839 [Tilletiaria anomala UBC 951]KDN53489.1 hypothetical protein K437DRAFT_72839 [Tilletiaria anomala UBC 951]